MSVEYYFVCHECKEKLHIGCDGMSGFQFWYGDESIMKSMKSMLARCVFHYEKLGFTMEQTIAEEEYSEYKLNSEEV